MSNHETNLEKKFHEVWRWFTWSSRHPLVPMHFGVLNIGKMGRNQILTVFWRFFCIRSYPLEKNAISSNLKMVSSQKLMKNFENGSSLRSEDTPKTAFLVILGHFENLMVGQGHIFELKLEWRSFLGHHTLRFQTKRAKNPKNARKIVIFRLSTIFPILRTPKCIGTRGCLEDQVNHLQTSWNFFSRFVSWFDTVKKWFTWIWRFFKKKGANRSPYCTFINDGLTKHSTWTAELSVTPPYQNSLNTIDVK